MEAYRNLSQINAGLVADYILQNHGPMSHLKLQKLLYYCESYHLAYFGKSLIHEEFQAWVHGPVCREVYDSLKGESRLYADITYGGEGNPTAQVHELLSSSQIELVTDVLTELSTWSGTELENATHKDWPWREARAGLGPAEKSDRLISKETMKNFYSSELNG